MRNEKEFDDDNVEKLSKHNKTILQDIMYISVMQVSQWHCV